MTEGGEDMEMGERGGGEEVRYENLDNEALNNEYDSLEDRLARNPNDDMTKRKISHINTLWGSEDANGVLRLRRRNTPEGGQMETDFGGGGRSDALARIRHDQAVSKVETFIKERLGVDINWRVDEGKDLDYNISLSKGSNVLYRRMGDKGLFVDAEIVLKMRKGVLYYNDAKSESIMKAVKAFKDSIGRAAEQSREVEVDIESMPMIADDGSTLGSSGGEVVMGESQLPPGVYDRLSDDDQREIDGALSITLSKSTKMYDREKHLRIEIDKWEVRKMHAEDAVRSEPDEGKAIELQQKVSDCDVVIESIRDRIELEKTYGEQVEDVTRLQRLKKWIKENLVGLSAVGITVASLITTVIIGMRTAITKGAQAVSSFAKMVKNAIAKLGPWAVGLANFVYTVLKFGAQALAFLARNLWLVVVTVAYFLWEMYKNRQVKKK